MAPAQPASVSPVPNGPRPNSIMSQSQGRVARAHCHNSQLELFSLALLTNHCARYKHTHTAPLARQKNMTRQVEQQQIIVCGHCCLYLYIKLLLSRFSTPLDISSQKTLVLSYAWHSTDAIVFSSKVLYTNGQQIATC